MRNKMQAKAVEKNREKGENYCLKRIIKTIKKPTLLKVVLLQKKCLVDTIWLYDVFITSFLV